MQFRNRYNKLISLLVYSLIFFLSTLVLKYYLKPIIIIIVIVFLCTPLFKILVKLHIPIKLSGAISILIINLTIIIVLVTLGKSILNLLIKLYNANIEFIQIQIISFGAVFEEAKKIGILDKLLSLVNSVSIKASAINIGEQMVAYFIGNIGAFFFITDKGIINSFICEILPKKIIEKGNKQKKTIKELFLLQIIFIIISTCEIIIGFSVLKVENAILLGIICGILDLLPYIGTIIVFIPIIIYNIIVKDYFVAFGLICLYILVQIIREFLEAKYISDKLELHPLLILLSVYIGVKLFGVIGFFIGPLYGLLAKELIYDKKDNTT